MQGGVVRSKELSLCTIKEIKRELKKGETEVNRVSIKKEGENNRDEYLYNEF